MKSRSSLNHKAATSRARGTLAGCANIVLSLNIGASFGTNRLEEQINNGTAVFSDSTGELSIATVRTFVKFDVGTCEIAATGEIQ